MPLLQTDEGGFTLDGEPFRLLSGGLHYFRVHPDQWADRLRKARLMGLNTVETYVPWNLHQPRPDRFTLDGGLDLPRFLDLAAAEGLYVLLRPGPYICAEWEGGGIPSWLLAEPDMRLRSRDPGSSPRSTTTSTGSSPRSGRTWPRGAAPCSPCR